MGEVFIRRLRALDGQAKEGLAKALKTASGPALVRSAFDLPAEQRAAIQNALNETFSAEVHVKFETAPDLVSGIEAHHEWTKARLEYRGLPRRRWKRASTSYCRRNPGPQPKPSLNRNDPGPRQGANEHGANQPPGRF